MKIASHTPLVVLVAFALTGCSALAPKPTLLDAPEGFSNVENQMALRPASEQICSVSGVSCKILDVFAIKDCPGGAYVEARVVDGVGAVIGMTNTSLPALRAGDCGRFEMLITEANAADAELSVLRCT